MPRARSLPRFTPKSGGLLLSNRGAFFNSSDYLIEPAMKTGKLSVIDNAVVGIGSDLNGVSIVGIQKGRIDARYEGADISLKFNNE